MNIFSERFPGRQICGPDGSGPARFCSAGSNVLQTGSLRPLALGAEVIDQSEEPTGVEKLHLAQVEGDDKNTEQNRIGYCRTASFVADMLLFQSHQVFLFF